MKWAIVMAANGGRFHARCCIPFDSVSGPIVRCRSLDAGPGQFGPYQIATFSGFALFFPLAQVRTVGAALVFVSYVVCLAMSAFEILIGAILMSRTRLPAFDSRQAAP